MRVIVDKYLSYDQIIRIGTKASSSSSRYSRIIDENQVRDKFRNAAVNKIKTSIDKVIMGHSHVCDDFKVNRMDKEIHYLNNGYPPKSGKYILAHDGEISLQAITIE